MKISDKRKAGDILGRGGMSQRIICIAREISKGTYKEAIENAGRIAEIVDASTCDEYWNEKATIGKYKEHHSMEMLISGKLARDKAICAGDMN